VIWISPDFTDEVPRIKRRSNEVQHLKTWYEGTSETDRAKIEIMSNGEPVPVQSLQDVSAVLKQALREIREARNG
jgi:hypothetical protein